MTAALADNEIWHVLMGADDMKRMNVEQLDDAFRLSLIDASTLVWQTGMQRWQRLGSIADLEDEPEELIESWPAPSLPRVTHAAPPTRAPVHAPPMFAVAPYVVAQGRAELPEKVDFRRASAAGRWGRRFFAMLVIAAAVLGAYRYNLLREGARRLGVESRYLVIEQRATAFVSANAAPSVRGFLGRLALLPGPNASAEGAQSSDSTPSAIASAVRANAPVPPAPAPAPAAQPCVAVAKDPAQEPEIKAVSFDSLPVLRGGGANAKPAPPEVASGSKRATKADVPSRAKRKHARGEATASRATASSVKASSVKAAPRKKVRPKAEAAPRPHRETNPLKAAMSRVVASDAKKLRARQ